MAQIFPSPGTIIFFRNDICFFHLAQPIVREVVIFLFRVGRVNHTLFNVCVFFDPWFLNTIVTLHSTGFI